jgi:hypothetical protein
LQTKRDFARTRTRRPPKKRTVLVPAVAAAASKWCRYRRCPGTLHRVCDIDDCAQVSLPREPHGMAIYRQRRLQAPIHAAFELACLKNTIPCGSRAIAD